MAILLEDLNLRKAEKMMCLQALEKGGSIVEAALLLGITRHALKRRIIKHGIRWNREGGRIMDANDGNRVAAGASAAAAVSV